MKEIEKLFVSSLDTIEKAVLAIQVGGEGIALVIDEDRHLLGTITDGDIRRAILNKIPLDTSIGVFLKKRPKGYSKPTVATVNTPHGQLLKMMEKKVLRQIPILNENGQVVELALLTELIEEEHYLPITAVIMAGGKGKRLLPLTKDLPKPMLPLENTPIIERIIRQLAKAGIKDVYISTNYKAQIIKDYFEDGKQFGIQIKYIHENVPLGTAGALSLIEVPKQITLVINGDILTQLDFRSMYDFHRFHKADMTVGVRIYEFEIPYGVIEMDDIYVKKLVEKPIQASIVNAGVYLLEPGVYNFILLNERLDMTDLIEKIILQHRKVVSFPVQEYWLDVGHPVDYERAKDDFRNGIFEKDTDT